MQGIGLSRPGVSLLVLVAAFVLLLWFAADVLLAVFAGVLVAVFLRGGGTWTARLIHVREGIGLAVFCLVLVLATAGFLAVAGVALADQAQQLVDSLPSAIEQVRAYINERDWMRRVVDQLEAADLVPSGGGAASALSGTLGVLGNAVVIGFIGLYGAVSPGTYIRGATRLVSPSLRPRAAEMAHESGVALRQWLKAQLISMAIVGLCTALGLWALGIPLFLILAVIAAVFTFIPNVGPVVAAVPAVLLALSIDTTTMLLVLGLYLAVQMTESYLITPRIQQESVSLPPGLTIAVQMLFGVLFGILGLALATPLAAMILRLVRKFYVRDYLEDDDTDEPSPAQGRMERGPD